MPTLVFLISAFELLGFFGFLLLARLPDWQAYRYIPFGIMGYLVIWLLTKQRRLFSLKQTVAVSFWIALLVVIGFQLLGMIFPGLAKDMDLVSMSNFIRLVWFFLIVWITHIGLLIAIHYWRNIRT